MATAGHGTRGGQHRDLGRYHFTATSEPELLFCDNDTNGPRLYGAGQRAAATSKTASTTTWCTASAEAVNPAQQGTKAAAHYQLQVPAGAVAQRAPAPEPGRARQPRSPISTQLFAARQREADEFYDCTAGTTWPSADARNVQRQAFAGMLWSKQYLLLRRGPVARRRPRPCPRRPPSAARAATRDWRHLHNADIISMPDKWEYPWYAAWDLAFHCIPLAMVDADFAKQQLRLLHQRLVHAPQRPAAGLRVELQRREPARARLGHLARVPDGQEAARRRRATPSFWKRCSISCC